MRILVIGRAVPSKENNMLGIFEYDQAKMLARNGHEVYYLFIDLRSLRHWRKIGLVKQNMDGIHLVTMNLPIGRALPAKLRNRLYAPLRRYQMKVFCRYFGTPDVVYVHFPSAYPYSLFTAFQNQGSKIIGIEHWSKVQNQDLPEANLQFLRNFVEKADTVICVGGVLRKSILHLTGTKREIEIIPNIVSPLFSYKAKEKSKNCFNFLAVGRLSAEKGYDKLIHAFCSTFMNDNTAHLHIAGGGDKYCRLHELIQQYQAEDRVTLHGILQKEELVGLYHQCDALVMPSDYETFGIPAAEAMACGLPVIVTQNTGMAHYITEDFGVIMDDNRIETIAAAMMTVRKSIDKYDGQMLSEFANTHFSESVVYEKINNVFEKAVKGEQT